MNFEPKLIIYAALAVPVLWALMDGGAEGCEGGWSPLILAATALGGGVYFHDNFVHKSVAEEKKPIDLGKQPPNEKYREEQGEPPTLRYPNFPPKGG